MEKNNQLDIYKGYIQKFKNIRTDLRHLKEVFLKILTDLASDITHGYIVEGRVKAIPSFAEKIIRKNYENPLKGITDLCGVRVILPNLYEVEKIGKMIEELFEIDWENSEKKVEQLKVNETGYLSDHYVVSLIENSSGLYEKFGFDDDILKLSKYKVEIQVRTFLQHQWAVNQHGRFYKGEFDPPWQYRRELFLVAANLEIADKNISTVMKKLEDYESSYGRYFTKDEIQEELKRLKLVYEVGEQDLGCAFDIAKFYMELEKWEEAIEYLTKAIDSPQFATLRDIKAAKYKKNLGISMGKKHKKGYKQYLDTNNSEDYKEEKEGFEKAVHYIQASLELNPEDVDAMSSLGGLWKDINNTKAMEYYKKALKIDEGDPYPLGNYLILKIESSKDLDVIRYNESKISKAIQKRENHVEVDVDIPWAFFDLGLFHLFRQDLIESLEYYILGIRDSTELWMIQTTLDTFIRIEEVRDQLTGYGLVKSVLLLGALHKAKSILKKRKQERAQKNADQKLEEEIKDLENLIQEITNNLNEEGITSKVKELKPPVVILAGGTDKSIEKKITGYKETLIKAFNGFRGTIISGGTSSGISGFAGALQEIYRRDIRTLGYMPKENPWNVQKDTRYTQIITTDGSDFSFLESIQYWYDLITNGVEATDVKLIGINGGGISALEFRLAITLGAKVGIISGSGREASKLIKDELWVRESTPSSEEEESKRFQILESKPEKIRSFLGL